MSEPTPLPMRAPHGDKSEALALTSMNGGGYARNALSHFAYDDYRAEQRGLHLRDYWHTLRKHLWLVIGITVLIPTLVAIYLIRKPDIFEAQARIQVDLEAGNSLLGGMSKKQFRYS